MADMQQLLKDLQIDAENQMFNFKQGKNTGSNSSGEEKNFEHVLKDVLDPDTDSENGSVY